MVKVNVRQVLTGIESVSARKESTRRVTNIYISGDVKDSNILAGDENEMKKYSLTGLPNPKGKKFIRK